MKSNAFWCMVGVGLAVLALPRAARAQYTSIYTGRTFNNPISASLDLSIQQSMQRRMMYRGMLRNKGYTEAEIQQILEKPESEVMAYLGKRKPVTASPARKTSGKPVVVPDRPADAAPASRFKPSGKRLLLGKAADALGTTAKEKADLRTALGAVMDAYEKEAKRMGFPNDVAGAMAFYTESSYKNFRPDATETSDAGTVALVRQFQSALNSDAMRQAAALDKQILYEYYLVMGSYMYVVAEAARQEPDDKTKEAVAKLGGEGLRSLFKIDPGRIRLTENGVEIAPEG